MSDPGHPRVDWISKPLVTGGMTALIFIGLALFTVARSFDPDAFNHDVAWILYASGRLMDGARLYIDVVDNNPPLVFWLSAIPVAASRLFGATDALAYNIFVLCIAALSIWTCDAVLKRAWKPATKGYRPAVASLLATAFLALPGYEVGQRDHLMCMLVMPYIFASAGRMASDVELPRRILLPIGVCSAIGFMLKPFFLLLWVVFEAHLFFSKPGKRAWKRLDNLIIVALLAALGAITLVFASEYLRIARMAVDVYGAYSEMSGFLTTSPVLIAAPLAASLLYFLFRPFPRTSELCLCLLIAMVVFLLTAVAQFKGFAYHFVPALTASAALGGLALLGFVEKLGESGKIAAAAGPAARGALILLITLLVGQRLAYAADRTVWRDREPARQSFIDAVTAQAGGKTVVVFSTDLRPAFPAVNLAGARWASRFSCYWLIPGLYSPEERATVPFPYRDPAQMGDTERYFIDSAIEDMTRWPPDLIVVDRRPVKQAMGLTAFDFLVYFMRDTRFAKMFEAYREVGALGPFVFYRRVV